MKDIVFAIAQWSCIFLIRGVVIILGLVMVPLGLLFRNTSGMSKPFRDYPHREWIKVDLVGIFSPWGNERDGMIGDHRGSWDNQCGDAYKLWSMYKWSAIRNPANRFSRYTLGIDLRENRVIFLKGHNKDLSEWDRGWNFLKAGPYFKFEARWRWKDINCHILLGHKLKSSHIGREADSWEPGKSFKGPTFKITPN